MASKALLRRKKEEKKISKKLVVTKELEIVEKCPVFKVHYLGKTPARGEYGREFIDEPVETLLKLKDRQSKLPKTLLQITEKGFHFLNVNGPFGKEKHVRIPIHHVCYGVADEQNPQVFAIITRTDSNPENSLLECHAFLCDRRKVAAQITYWLLRTFLYVFEDLQRRRRARQERKMRRLQVPGVDPEATTALGAAYQDNHQVYDISPRSPTETISPDIYSITLEGSKENGGVTAVSLTKNRPPGLGNNSRPREVQTGKARRANSGKKFATVPAMRYGSQEDPIGSHGARRRQPVQQVVHNSMEVGSTSIHNSHESLDHHPPLRQSASASTAVESPGGVPRRQRNLDIISPRPLSFNGGRTNNTYPDDPLSIPPTLELEPLDMNGLSNPNAPLHHQQQERARYMKNPNVAQVASPAKPPANRGRGRPSNRPLSSTGTSPSSRGSSARSSLANEESDFIFIQMLQEEFSEFDAGSSDTNSTIRRVAAPYPARDRNLPSTGKSTPAAPPLDQKLRSEDIEKRIREWLKRTSPDAEFVEFDDSGLDRISLAGTLARHNSSRTEQQYVPRPRSAQSPISQRSAAGTFNHIPTSGEYF